MSIDIAINGMGRIGRQIFREALRRGFSVRALNDVADFKTLMYLLEFDSTHGHFDIEYQIDGDILQLEYNGKKSEIKLNNSRSIESVDLNSAQVVLECSGKFSTSSSISPYLKQAKKVIIASNVDDDTSTYVIGVNHLQYKGERIISNASCTTNCISPICNIINAKYGISSGFLMTVHSYTNNQSLLDSAHSDKRRSRSAPNNIIPTSTGALKGMNRVLGLNSLQGYSVRVPVMDVSMADISVSLKCAFSCAEVKEMLIDYAQNELAGILEIDYKQRVSSDFIGNTASGIIPLDLVSSSENMLKIIAWYDNEIGYSNRVLDMALHIS